MTTLKTLEKNGLSENDKICLYCSRLFSPLTDWCGFCQEYKGMIRVVDAIDCYGEDVLNWFN